MKKLLFIMNPFAGQKKANKVLPEILMLFTNAGYDIHISMTTGPGSATRLAAERATQSKAEAEANEATIKAQARYEAEVAVRELEAQLWEKDSLIHALQAETAKLKTKLAKLHEYLCEKKILENFLTWVKGGDQHYSRDTRER